MKKVVCPDCGGNLMIEYLYQYGLQHKVSSTGRILSRTKKVDGGPLNDCILYCPACRRNFDDEEYSMTCDYIRLGINTEDEDHV